MFDLDFNFILLTVGGLASLEAAAGSEKRGGAVGNVLHEVLVRSKHSSKHEDDALSAQETEKSNGWRTGVQDLARAVRPGMRGAPLHRRLWQS